MCCLSSLHLATTLVVEASSTRLMEPKSFRIVVPIQSIKDGKTYNLNMFDFRFTFTASLRYDLPSKPVGLTLVASTDQQIQNIQHISVDVKVMNFNTNTLTPPNALTFFFFNHTPDRQIIFFTEPTPLDTHMKNNEVVFYLDVIHTSIL